ncbi:hypothetical protein ACWDR9_33240, partial [Streptosporangium sandarakinum]
KAATSVCPVASKASAEIDFPRPVGTSPLACGVAAATVLGAFLHPVPGRRGSLGTALRAGDLG